VSFKLEIKQSSIPQNGFIDDFTESLSAVCTAFDCLIITGDLNVHVDVAHNKTS